MKKLSFASVILTCFSLSIILVQFSCSKNTDAQAPNNPGLTQLNKLVYFAENNTGFGGDIWIANYDGSNQTKVNITIPSGYVITSYARLSPDGKTLFFVGENKSTEEDNIYSCNIDGSNVKEIVDGSTFPQEGVTLGGAY